jgi:hypothetical protein
MLQIMFARGRLLVNRDRDQVIAHAFSSQSKTTL